MVDESVKHVNLKINEIWYVFIDKSNGKDRILLSSNFTRSDLLLYVTDNALLVKMSKFGMQFFVLLVQLLDTRYGWVVIFLARTTKVLCLNLGATRNRTILGKPLTAVCLGSPGRYILIRCDIHRTLAISQFVQGLKWLSRGTLGHATLLSTATANNSCRKTIGLSKLSPDSTR
jgi:hypothetical protein